jgi:amidase
MSLHDPHSRANAFLPYPYVLVPRAASGALCGCRLAVKDVFDVAGYPTGAGSALVLAASGVKDTTAPIVRTLLAAGAEYVGKTYTDEIAYSLIGKNDHFVSPINPRWPDRIVGGSSSGSAAAVAAGLADIGLGTDTSGSIRLPATANGLFGWRPTHGLLSLEGCRPVAPSFDAVGFLTRSLETMETLMGALSVEGAVGPDPTYVIPSDLMELCESAIAREFAKHVASLGNHPQIVNAETAIDLGLAQAAFNTILRREAYETNADLLHNCPGSLDPTIRERLRSGESITPRELSQAKDFRAELKDRVGALLSDNAFLLMPTLPTIVPHRDAPQSELDEFRARSISYCCIAGLCGFPQLSVPISSPETGTLSFSVIGIGGADRRALAAARFISP